MKDNILLQPQFSRPVSHCVANSGIPSNELVWSKPSLQF